MNASYPEVAEELDDISSRSYNIHNVFGRLKKKGDPWKNIDEYARPAGTIKHTR